MFKVRLLWTLEGLFFGVVYRRRVRKYNRGGWILKNDGTRVFSFGIVVDYFDGKMVLGIFFFMELQLEFLKQH